MTGLVGKRMDDELNPVIGRYFMWVGEQVDVIYRWTRLDGH